MALNKIIRSTISPDLSKLTDFAAWFHQDFRVLHGSFDEGVNEFLSGLSDSKRAAFKLELLEFVEINEQTNSNSLKKKWQKMGAQYTPSELCSSSKLRQIDESI